MWQRQIQPLAFSGTSWHRAAGCGSWTRQTSQPPVSSRALISLNAPPSRPLLLVEILGGSLQGVVHELGRVEELFAPVDHLPLAVQADVAHQRHERVEDLRDPSAERGCGDVHDALALERLGQLLDLGDQVPTADVRVVGERLVTDGDGLEHAAARYLNRARKRARGPAAGLWLANDQLASVPGGVRAVPVRVGRGGVLVAGTPGGAELDAGAGSV